MKISKILMATIVAAGMLTSCSESKSENNEASPSASGNATEAVINNIMSRCSVREFTNRPISKDTLDLVVKAGMAAPSAVNSQPWAFIVVNEKEVLDKLNAIENRFNLKTATAAIIVCGDMSKALKDKGKDYWVQDCSAATENILLAAHAYGLGAVWCGVYPGEETVKSVSAALGLPENIIPLNVITMGYPDDANAKPKDKFKQDNIHYNKW